MVSMLTWPPGPLLFEEGVGIRLFATGDIEPPEHRRPRRITGSKGFV